MLANPKIVTTAMNALGIGNVIIVENGDKAMMRFKELKGMGDERSDQEEEEFMTLKKKFMNMRNPKNGKQGKMGAQGKMGDDSKY